MTQYNQKPDHNEDLDCIDLNNYKGMFYNDDSGLKYQDAKTGAHFEFENMCKRLIKLKKILPDYQKDNNSNEFDHKRQKNSLDKSFLKFMPQSQETRNNKVRSINFHRSEARRGGKECLRLCSTRESP